jgi:uncharacterized protein (UPF0335 family)
MSGAGHNIGGAGRLRSFIERVERVEEEIKELNASKSDIYKEARGEGFDVKTMRKVVSARKLDPADRDEADALFDLYWSALNGTGTDDATHVHVHEAKSYAEAKVSSAPVPKPVDDEDDYSPPAFLAREQKPLRPYCRHPDDTSKCAGVGRKHCHTCAAAMPESEAA